MLSRVLSLVLVGVISTSVLAVDNSKSVTISYIMNIGDGTTKSGFELSLVADKTELSFTRYDEKGGGQYLIGLGGSMSTLEESSDDIHGSVGGGVAMALGGLRSPHSGYSWFLPYVKGSMGITLDSSYDSNTSVQFGYVQYGGLFENDHGEQFMTIGISQYDVTVSPAVEPDVIYVDRVLEPEVITREVVVNKTVNVNRVVNVERNVTVNREVNVERNVTVNRDVNIDRTVNVTRNVTTNHN